MIDNIKSIFENIGSKFSAPLFGCFFVSWCIANHPVVIMLLSGDSAAYKVSYIEAYFIEDFELFMIRSIVTPVIATWFYFYIYPRVEIAIYIKHLENLRERNKVKQGIFGAELLTKEESIDIRRKADEIKEKYDKEIKSVKQEMQNYKELYENAAQELREEKEIKERELSKKSIKGLKYDFGRVRSEEPYSNMSVIEASILGCLIDSSSEVDFFGILEELEDFSDIEIKRNIQLLEDEGYIQKINPTLDGNFTISLSKKGREFERKFGIY